MPTRAQPLDVRTALHNPQTPRSAIPVSPSRLEMIKEAREDINRGNAYASRSSRQKLSGNQKLRISTGVPFPMKIISREGSHISLDCEQDETDTETSPCLTRESSFFYSSGTTLVTSPDTQTRNGLSWMSYDDSSPPISPTFGCASAAGNHSRPEWELPELSQAWHNPTLPSVSTHRASPCSPTTFKGTVGLKSSHRISQQIKIPDAESVPNTETVFPAIIPLDDQSSSDPLPDVVHSCDISGEDLEPFVIAHDPKVQILLDQLRISYGVQYEIARGVSNKLWRWSDVTAGKLRQLTGPNAVAAQRVAHLMRPQGEASPKVSPSDLVIWQELDREQKAMLEDRTRGLGLLGDWEGVPNWYGGRVQQIARLVEDPETGSYQIRLERLEMRTSNRFARLMGSRRIMQLRISRTLHYRANDNVRRFLQQKFVLCGRVFIPFHAKESVYMVEIGENFHRHSDSCGDQFRMSLEDFVRWHNSLERNWKQPISKWTTRWALGLSTSVPVLEFDGDNMFYIEDIYAESWNERDDPRAEQIMTDGCGFVNGAALVLIARNRNLPNRPTAVQGRIAGAKGLWVLNPYDRDPKEPPRIWIRKSQRKIDLGPFSELARAHRIFELVAPSRTTTPDRLSMQSILNLSHNGVADEVFVSLMQEALQEEVRKLTSWTRPNAMVFLCHAINSVGNVSGSRMQRQALGTSRALGLTGRDFSRHDDTPTEGEDQDLIDDVEYSGHNPYSGHPLTLHESALELVQAGFHPTESHILYKKIQSILTLVIDNLIKNFHYPVLQSARAFIIPDPCGVLREGEIYFRSSEPLKDPETDCYFDILTGDVIVARNPMRVPSDMRKVKAVDHAELAGYYDVAVFPIKGSRSLQSWLSGGDSDGDEAQIIWEPSLTSRFSNSDFTSREEGFIEAYFNRDATSLIRFGEQLERLPSREAQQEFQKMLLLGLDEKANVGLYSHFHDNAVYAFGYSDHRTVRLAHMFETVLDAAKSGLQVKPKTLEKDKRAFDRGRPACMKPVECADFGHRNVIPLRRDGKLGQFVLDSLVKAGESERRSCLKEYDELGESSNVLESEKPDRDLERPYEVAKQKALEMIDRFPVLMAELKAIEKHVGDLHRAWGKGYSRSKQRSPGEKSGRSSPFGKLCQELVKRYAEDVEDIFLTPNIEEIKASYAYKIAPKFSFSMAFRELCAIKARAKGQGPITQLLLETMKIPSSSLRALAQNIKC